MIITKEIKFVIEVNNNSQENIYVNDTELNDSPALNQEITHRDITNGGTLKLEMGNVFSKSSKIK